ncbi:MAG: hypothetical protein K5768_06885, partial [Firmicutes bacterium]|nr:hypothetical protein [Bacillota bacterium]
SKSDAAENSNFEPVKGGISDSFKRAAVKWNIGRYLYKLDPVWVTIDEYREITKAEQERLTVIYYEAITRIFGKETCEKLKAENAVKPQAKTSNQSADKQNKGKEKPKSPIFEVKNVSVNEGMNGKSSTLILSCGGKQYKTFMKGIDDRLKVGTKITNVKAEQRQNAMGKYTVLSSFDLAA